ncbi:MAG: hypothetical protein HY332_03765 [Chloroflexi bacterium]|nr:hypothetical protein [Chloroflexota bacterium]
MNTFTRRTARSGKSTGAEEARLRALYRTALLDTPPDDAFDRLTRLAANALRAPVALITLPDADRQFFKSQIGLPEPWASRRQTPLPHTFYTHEVASRGQPRARWLDLHHPVAAGRRDNMTPEELAAIKAWEARATPGPWEQGVDYAEAPANPGEGEWATWRDRDRVEPDLIWQLKHLPIGQCELCEDGPPIREERRDTKVSLYRRWDTGQGHDYVAETTRLVTFHLHRVARRRDTPLAPISSTTARQVVLDVVTVAGATRLVLSEADALFITRARDAVPQLVAEVERLQEQVQRLEAIACAAPATPAEPAEPTTEE